MPPEKPCVLDDDRLNMWCGKAGKSSKAAQGMDQVSCVPKWTDKMYPRASFSAGGGNPTAGAWYDTPKPLYMNVMKSIVSHFCYAQPGAVFQEGGILNARGGGGGWREGFKRENVQVKETNFPLIYVSIMYIRIVHKIQCRITYIREHKYENAGV